MIRQHTSGIYTWLPRFRVLKNIEEIMSKSDSIGCNKMLMSTIQSSELWSGRYPDYGKEMLRIMIVTITNYLWTN